MSQIDAVKPPGIRFFLPTKAEENIVDLRTIEGGVSDPCGDGDTPLSIERGFCVHPCCGGVISVLSPSDDCSTGKRRFLTSRLGEPNIGFLQY